MEDKKGSHPIIQPDCYLKLLADSDPALLKIHLAPGRAQTLPSLRPANRQRANPYTSVSFPFFLLGRPEIGPMLLHRPYFFDRLTLRILIIPRVFYVYSPEAVIIVITKKSPDYPVSAGPICRTGSCGTSAVPPWPPEHWWPSGDAPPPC